MCYELVTIDFKKRRTAKPLSDSLRITRNKRQEMDVGDVGTHGYQPTTEVTWNVLARPPSENGPTPFF